MTDHDQETTGRTVVGMFTQRDAAEAAIRDLRAAGFTEEQIGVAMQDGAPISFGVPAEDARHFDQGLRSGAILVTIDAGPRTREALAILERHGTDLGPSRRRVGTT